MVFLYRIFYMRKWQTYYSIILLIIFLNSTNFLLAQVIDNTSSFRNVSSDRYFRFHYDNDFFTKTDYYYSQGITLEYANPRLKKIPVYKLFFQPRSTHAQYGLTFNIWGYTPTSIKSDPILYGDRPYAAAISLKSFLIATDSLKKYRLSSSLSAGVIGPLALGKPIQTEIHRWLENKLPKGWKNQVQNDLLLNYQLSYEKNVLAFDNILMLNATATAILGTVNDKISTGVNFIAGHFNDPYGTTGKKSWQYYFYGQSRVHLVGYDAMMQGGLFNRKSPYTIAAGDISRLGFQADAGIVVNVKKLYLSYSQSFLSKEFRTGRYHRWGGINLAVSF